MREDNAQDYPILPTAESIAGVAYAAADGGKVHEKGKRVPVLKLENGSMKHMPFKVGKINKALGAVKDLCSAGNRVVFDDDGSLILDKKSGELYERGRTDAFPVQVIPRSIAVKLASASKHQLNRQEPSTSPFQRHAEQL